TWTATDACGNSSSVSQEIRFAELMDLAFTFVPGDVTLKLGGELPEDVAIATSTCEEGEVNMEISDVITDKTNCGHVVLRHFIASDACGNRDTAIQKITLIDDNPPVLTNTITHKNIKWSDEVVWDEPEFADPSGIASVTIVDTSVLGLCDGYYKRTWIAVDSCGHSTEVSQVITILPDTKGPQFTTK